MRRLGPAALAVLTILLLAPAGAHAHRLSFGMVAGLKWFGYPANMQWEARRVARAGARWDREDFSWPSIRPRGGTWRWARMDHVYAASAPHGITVLPVLDDVPPGDAGALAAFTVAVVRRYGPRGTFWRSHPTLDARRASTHFEILNEPYNAATPEARSPALYARMFKAAAIAGRRANPAARFLAAATTDVCVAAPCGGGDWVHWADGMVDAVPDIARYIDAIAVHPYPAGHDPDYQPVDGTDSSFKNTDVIHAEFAARGIDKPIWITEVGYSACDDPAWCVPGADRMARERQKAAWLGQLLDELGTDAYSYVDAVFVFAFKQPSRPLAANKDAWFQIVSPTGRRLPAYGAYAAAAAAFSSSPRLRP
jgi:hypothetical protein